MNWLLNKKDIEWIKGLFGIKPKPKPEPQPEVIREIIHTPYETVMLRARVSETELQRYAVVDPNYTETQIKNELAMDLMQQILNQHLIEFKRVENYYEFNQSFIEATILVSIKEK
jgi:hypothetical protein